MLRTDCQRCHVGVKGRDKRGDYRGMGCAACHIPYNNAGLYEGGDPSVKRDEAGHAMVHSIQSSRKAKVVVNDTVYSGIPHETCVSCHNRGKRIGVLLSGADGVSLRQPLYESRVRNSPSCTPNFTSLSRTTCTIG